MRKPLCRGISLSHYSVCPIIWDKWFIGTDCVPLGGSKYPFHCRCFSTTSGYCGGKVSLHQSKVFSSDNIIAPRSLSFGKLKRLPHSVHLKRWSPCRSLPSFFESWLQVGQFISFVVFSIAIMLAWASIDEHKNTTKAVNYILFGIFAVEGFL